MLSSIHYCWVLGGAILATVAVYCVTLLMKERQKSQGYVAALEEATNFMGHGLVFFDENSRFNSANEKAFEFLPDFLDPKGGNEDIELTTLLDYFFDHAVEYDESLMNALERPVVGASSEGFREVIMTANEKLCLVEAQKIKGLGTNILLINVDDIKHQEDILIQLNEHNYELNQAVQAANSGIIITKSMTGGRLQKVVFANKAFCSACEVQREDIIGKNITEFFERVDNADALQEIRRLAEDQQEGSVEFSIQHSECGVRWYELKLTPVVDAQDNLQMFVAIMTDVTEMKVREAESSKAQKLEALGQLSAGVAHDFNNLLSIIDGYAHITAGILDNKDKSLANLQKIRTAAHRGTNLIKQMLTFSRHEIVHDAVIDLGAMIREQETLLRPLLDASIRAKFLIDNTDMYVECPPDNFTQILMNLVVNARDAMPQGGTLLVEGRVCHEDQIPEVLKDKNEGRGFVKISVADTGSGIEEDKLPQIFDPFFTTKEQGKGTGLGLSMVYGLLQQIGGHVEVESKLGQGTAFNTFFPLSEKTPKKIVGDLADIASLRFDGFTALVAEDEPDLLMLVCNILEERGMYVLRAGDGHEALAVQDDYFDEIDILLTDVVMPELNGVELANLMEDVRPDMQVVFMSGYPDKGQMARVEIPENAVFMPKPINHDDLITLLYAKLYSDQDEDQVSTARWSSKSDDEVDDADVKEG